ncbi:MAG: type VII toxin-antitoxin system MntA family adenylyltransferase antitoxin [Thermoanaerobaculia bacterium]
MDQTAIENRLREILTALAEREGIAAAYLFGSVARGTARLGSDIDVGVLYSEDPPLSLAGLGLQDELERALGLPIRVVVLNRVAPELAFRILNDNRLLVEWDRGARTNFEVNSRNEYWDFEPVLHLYRHTNILPVPSVEDLLQRERLTRS